MPRPAYRDDRGAAVVEFVLVSILLVACFLGVVQLGLVLHVRNTLVACAAEGARYAANADRSPADGAAHAQQLIRAALADTYASDVRGSFTTVGGAPAVVVEVHAPLPVVGVLGPTGSLVVRGHALDEDAL